MHVKCPSIQKYPSEISIFRSRTHLFIFYIFYSSSLARARMSQATSKGKALLMSLFQLSDGFSIKSAELRRSPFSVGEENDKFYFDRWSKSFIMIPSLSFKPVIHLESFLKALLVCESFSCGRNQHERFII